MAWQRCAWVSDDPSYLAYHDTEWGVPVHEDAKLFEMLILEGAQAGLSWLTILRKRAAYRRAFDGFDPEKIARYGERDIETLMSDEGIVRNRRKIEATVANARAFLAVRTEHGRFADYIWPFVGGQPLAPKRKRAQDVPTSTAESAAMSKDLKRRGFRFVGPTICYAYMQAVGMTNDHTTDCFRYRELRTLAGGDPGAMA
jgi:DNA-3-methyladenine glycosylase I